MNQLNYGQGLLQDGVFFFTNPTKEDFKALWNNKEYTFTAKTTTPLVIANEPPENVQHIRKLFAKKLALREFHNSKRYQELVKKGGYIPATYDEDTELGPVIQSCLLPLPKGEMQVKELPRDDERNYKGTKPIKGTANLNEVFKDYEIPTLGQM